MPKSGANRNAFPEIHDDEAVEPSEPMLPAGSACVRLAGCPVRLSLWQEEHLHELIRELQLVGTDREPNIAGAWLGATGPSQWARTCSAHGPRAAAEGREFIDVDRAVPREFSAEVQKLDMAVKAADVLCEEMRVLWRPSRAEGVYD